MRITILPCGGF